MFATREMLAVQAERERQWRKEDMELAISNLRAARGNTVGVWCGVVFAVVMGILSFVWTVWNASIHVQTTSSPQTTSEGAH